jgi:hypothetical protein
MEREKGYQQLDDAFGHPFASMRVFCATPAPHGLGFDPAVLEALAQETRQMTLGEKVAEIEELGAHGDDHKSAVFQGSRNYLEGTEAAGALCVSVPCNRDKPAEHPAPLSGRVRR